MKPVAEIGRPRRPCEWAALHAGVEFVPMQDQRVLALRQGRWSIDIIAKVLVLDPLEVERSLARTCRTLATWERNACKWATRYVAIEPNVAEYGDSRSSSEKRG